MGEVLETIPLKSVTSVERKSFLGHRVIRLHASHDELAFKTFEKEGEAKLIEAIEAGRNKENSPGNVEPSPSQIVASADMPPAADLSANPTSSGDTFDKLKKLGDLRDAGVLTEEEFEAKKKQLLDMI